MTIAQIRNLIDAAIDAAYAAALANPQRQPAQPVNGDPSATVRVDTYTSTIGSGFCVVGQVVLGDIVLKKVRQHGPDTASEHGWKSFTLPKLVP